MTERHPLGCDGYPLLRQSLAGWAKFTSCTALLLFIPGGIFYVAGCIWLVLISTSTLAITLYLWRYDRALLARRVKAGREAETEIIQKRIIVFASLACSLPVLIPAFDHRFSWSEMSALVAVLGDVLSLAGLFIVFLAFRANSFAAATISIAENHKVISTGPYSFVRHPMYAGALLTMAATPLALGSWVGLITIAPITAVLVWRLNEEEKYLSATLPGYEEYRSKVTSRLIPCLY
jgi:protein-S-isoprenylcysteine O-methyltransferase Ste14